MVKNQSIFVPQEIYLQCLEKIGNIRFTRREIDIISFMISGRSAKKTASFFALSPKTVENYTRNIMGKLECSSRETIIDFVEQSERFQDVKRYYESLLINGYFECQLKDISLLLKEKISLIFYYQEEEAQSPLVQSLVKHLEMIGINVSLRVWNDRETFLQLLHKENIRGEFIICLISCDFIREREVQFTFTNQQITNLCKNVLLLFLDDSNYQFIQYYFPNFNYLKLKDNNYYDNVFTIFQRIYPYLNLKELHLKFREKYHANQQDSSTFSPQVPSKNPDISQKENHIYIGNQTRRFILKIINPIYLLLISIIVGACGYLGFYVTTNKNKGVKFLSEHSSYENHQKKAVLHSIRSDLAIPAESILLNRPKILEQIDGQFKKQKRKIQIVVLSGVEGSGKTTLARQYARTQNASIVWEINAESKNSLITSIEKLIYALPQIEGENIIKILKETTHLKEKEEKIILFIKNYLKYNKNWFLIIDNVDKFLDIQDLFYPYPKFVDNGKIIITTKNRNIQSNIFLIYQIFIEELTLEEKFQLFTKIINNGEPTYLTFDQRQEIEKFLNNISPFPLDISLAAYYLKTTSISYEKYLENLKENQEDFNAIQVSILKEVGEYTKTRYKITTLSLKDIIQASKDFAELLFFISLLDSQNIPRELLEGYKSAVIVDNFIYHLKKYSLIASYPTLSLTSIPTISFHHSIQDISLAYLMRELGSNSKNQLLLELIMHRITLYCDQSIEQEDFSRMNILSHHIEKILTHDHLLSEKNKGLIKSQLGCIYYFLGQNAKSEKIIKDSLEILIKKSIDRNNHNIAHAFLNIGIIYTELGHYNEAQKLLEQSLDIYGKDLLRNKLEFAWVLSHLGNVYRRSGYYEKARSLLEKSITLQEECKVSNPRRIIQTLGCLGNVYRGLGDYRKAVEILEKSLKYCRQYFPNEHFRIGWILSHLGNVYNKLGDFEKAKDFFEKCLKIYKKYFSENHINVGLIFSYLGNCYRELKEYEKARFFLEKSLNIYESQSYKNYQKIAWVSFHLAQVYLNLSDHRKSKNLFQKTLIIYKDYDKIGDIERSQILRNIGSIYLLEEKLEDAENFLNQSLKILQGKQHPDTYFILEHLSDLYSKKSLSAAQDGNRRHAEDFKKQAIHQLTQALQIVTESFPPDSEHRKRLQSKLDALRPAA